jgi:hypothetical protein
MNIKVKGLVQIIRSEFPEMGFVPHYRLYPPYLV